MPDKPKTRTWKDPKTIIAAVSVTMLVTIWNTFATRDRARTGDTDEVMATPSAASQDTAEEVCPTSAPRENLGERCATVTQTRSS